MDSDRRRQMNRFQTLQEYIDHGLVELIGSAENQALSIGFSWHDIAKRACDQQECFTHCEIDGAFMSGTTSEATPFSNYNQSPRNTYQDAMAKQDIPYDTIQPLRSQNTSTHYLHYGQRPIVSASLNPARSENMYGINLVTVVVASPHTQEDNNEMSQVRYAPLLSSSYIHLSLDATGHGRNAILQQSLLSQYRTPRCGDGCTKCLVATRGEARATRCGYVYRHEEFAI